jgi:hypothetical protein
VTDKYAQEWKGPFSEGDVTRQQIRRQLFQVAFQEVTEEYRHPRCPWIQRMPRDLRRWLAKKDVKKRWASREKD